MTIRERPSWMTRSAYFVLEALAEVSDTSLPVQSPAVIAYNLDYTQRNVVEQLGELTEAGLVEKYEEGRYSVSDRGEQFLAGEIDASER